MGGAGVLLVFGRGVTPAPDGYALTTSSRARVDAAIAYLTANPTHPAKVIFTGGWAGAAEGAPEPPPGCREGDLMLARARAAGLDRHAELFTETRSRSTLENLLHTVEDGLLRGLTFSLDSPLGIVTHAWHVPRVRYLARKVLRLRNHELLDIAVTGDEDGRSERAIRLASRVCFLGARNERALRRRERLLVASVRLAGRRAR